MAKKVTVKIKGEETVSKASKKAGASLKGLRDDTKTISADLLTSFAAVTASVIAVGVALKQAFDLAMYAAEVNQIRMAFESIAADSGAMADDIIDNMRRMSGETISELDMMLAANRASLLGIPIQEFDNLMAIARASATATGESVQKMFNDIVVGIGRASPMILDNLGITVKIGKANIDYAKSIGKTVEQLTDQEKKQALLNAVLVSGEDIMRKVGEAGKVVTDVERWQQVTAAVADFKAELGTELLPVMREITGTITIMIRTWTEWLRRPREMKELKAAFKAVEEGVATFEQGIIVAQAKINDFEDDLRDLIKQHQDEVAVMEKAGLTYSVYLENILDQIKNVRELIEVEEKHLDTLSRGTEALGNQIQAGEKVLTIYNNQKLALEFINQEWAKLHKKEIQAAEQLEILLKLYDHAAEFWEDETAVEKLQEMIDLLVAQLFPLEAVVDLWNEEADAIERAWKYLDKLAASDIWDKYAEMYRVKPPGEFVPSPPGAEVEEMGIDLSGLGEVGQLISGMGDPLTMFGEALMTALISVESVAAIMNPFATILGHLTDMGSGLLNQALAPLVGVLILVADLLGAMLAPVIRALAPIIAAVAQILQTLLIPAFALLAPFIAFTTAIFEILGPIIGYVAIALDILLRPVETVGAILGWLGSVIVTLGQGIGVFLYNLTHWLKPKAYPTMPTLAGLAAEIAAIWARPILTLEGVGAGVGELGAEYLEGAPGFEPYEPAGIGSRTTIMRASDIYLTIYIENIYGAGGAEQAGMDIARVLQEYALTGGQIYIEEAIAPIGA